MNSGGGDNYNPEVLMMFWVRFVNQILIGKELLV